MDKVGRRLLPSLWSEPPETGGAVEDRSCVTAIGRRYGPPAPSHNLSRSRRALTCIASRSPTGSLERMTRDAFLFLSAFLASRVEMVEALTIVLAVGDTRGERHTLTLTGAAAAPLVLPIVVANAVPAVPLLTLGVLRIVVGGHLLVFGLQWLRK